MLTFTLAVLFDHFQFALIHGPDIPGSYAILLFTASNLSSITSHISLWQIEEEKVEAVTDFIFLGSKITGDCKMDSDCSLEIKRYLVLGRKVMTNLDSILKSRDIILPTRIYLVKAMVFPVVMYGCKSWTIKKAEC